MTQQILTLLKRVFLLFALSLTAAAALASLDWAVPAYGALGIRTPSSVCYWETLDWNQMSTEEKDMWAELGWTKKSWDSNNDSLAPPSDDKTWTDLTSTERGAAQALGYTQQTWENDTCPRTAEGDGGD